MLLLSHFFISFSTPALPIIQKRGFHTFDREAVVEIYCVPFSLILCSYFSIPVLVLIFYFCFINIYTYIYNFPLESLLLRSPLYPFHAILEGDNEHYVEGTLVIIPRKVGGL